ncbi:hypothetical protein IPF86_00735 [Candidatus Nomurabacteria bacterium]|nr:MAG: hypothetical protein IPF86_00735 [Candidatus Nomurabacteria bacterium]
MFTYHFFKMVLGLIGMILLGIGCLFIINAYEKSKNNTSNTEQIFDQAISPR